MTNIDISVIIPAFNEAERIGVTLQSVNRYFADKDVRYEIIVVDDGSHDATADTIESHKTSIKNLKLIRNGQNRGKGYSVRNGMLQASGEQRLFMDADNSVDISHLDAFIDEIKKGNDVVIGSIKIDNADVTEHAGWHRRGLSYISGFIIHMVVPRHIRDTQRGFKLFSREAAEKIFPLQTIERFGFDIEVLVIAENNGFKIKELPVAWDNPAGSTVTIKSYAQTLRELVRIWTNRVSGKYSSADLNTSYGK